MSKSYRIRTEVGKDKYINVLVEQDFEYLEILSLKILQSQIYTRLCSDYGVIAGRITANSGFGLPNCKVSVFIPLSNEDVNNPIISELYPYRSLQDTNEDGYRYNLLPYVKSHSGHNPTGSFPDRIDILTDSNLIEVYEKYYKFTAKTNDSGDFMIFGVPLGTQTIHVDIDLSDIGEFSLSPQDLVRLGVATEAQVSGTNFRSSTDLNSLPQIISLNRTISVEPLWGDPGVCTIGITRTDFDITSEAGINITPTAIFMGSIFSDIDSLALKRNCRPKFAQGELCSLIAGPGEILALRQTIFNDVQGRPILEQYELEGGGQVIDDNGTWLLDLPMNLDYVTTNEFGDRVFSDDPTIGIPTKGKYRFKIKWNQSPSLSENVKRAYFLVPNIKEYIGSEQESYAFSLDWDDYGSVNMLQEAIDCEDRFYQFTYNKVYTVSQLMDQYRRGIFPNRIISVKNILDNSCESDNNKFPTNDAQFRWDFIFLLYYFASYVFRPILVSLVFILHTLYFLLNVIKWVILPALIGLCFTMAGVLLAEAIANTANIVGIGAALAIVGQIAAFIILGVLLTIALVRLFRLKLRAINLPLLLYDQCEFCQCDDGDEIYDEDVETSDTGSVSVPAPVLPNISGLQITNLEGGQFNTEDIGDNLNLLGINRMLAGFPIQTSPNDTVCYSKTPYAFDTSYEPVNNTCTNSTDLKNSRFMTLSLTLAERINLFNTKAKYFNSSLFNPGGGVNRIKVKIEPTLNPTNEHYDNVVCVLMTPDSLSNLTSGTILTLIDPNKTSDINYSGAALNEFGTFSITGSSLFYMNNPGANPPTTTQINISCAKFDGTGNFPSVSYIIPAPSNTTQYYHKFPTDVEYFQVVTAMTYTQYNSQTSNALTNSLNSRFLNNTMAINIFHDIDDTSPCSPTNRNIVEFHNPLQELDEGDSQIVVFLVRGVDPYSPRVEIEYDLSILFGYQPNTSGIPQGQVKVKGDYKLNIPIQGKFKNVNHSSLTSFQAQNVDPYSTIDLYYNTFDYIPSSSPQNGFSSFTSNRASFYSSLSDFEPGIQTTDYRIFTLNCQNNECFGTPHGINGSNGFSIDGNNFYTKEYIKQENAVPRGLITCNGCTRDLLPVSNNYRGYFVNEIVEGASFMVTQVNNRFSNLRRFNYQFSNGVPQYSKYVAPKYSSGLTLTYTTGSSGRQIVMRSDRLPTSDRLLQNCDNNFFSLQQNQNLGIYIIPDEGAFSVPPNTGGGSNGPLGDDGTPPPNFTGDLIRSTNSCQDSVNLECYVFNPNPAIPGLGGQPPVLPGGGTYTLDLTKKKKNGKVIFDNGCYKLITKILISIPTDIALVTEWLSRTNITFGACRNIFSHTFTNNWVNGGLYAFAFKNNRFFDQNNQPYSEFCDDVVYFDNNTNNFYYRSSRYNGTTNKFRGTSVPTSTNQRNLLFPTTIIDLGPRTDYLQELVLSDEYDGYVVDKLKSTTFQDVSEMLNLLIITRLANSNFIDLMIGTRGASIFNFFSRPRTTVDGDYAQMISINSELGVSPFEADIYADLPQTPGQVTINPVYFNTGSFKDVVFGIFYTADTQVRDYITPKRTIISDLVPNNSPCAFNFFGCFSQEVPFYQWEIKDNENAPILNSIFGSQKNNWYTDNDTNLTSDGFFSFRYQALDRTTTDSRYFRTNTSNETRDFNGFIYSIDRRPVGISPYFTTPMLNPLPYSQDPNNPQPKMVTVGAPYHFYFGLKKGKTAWDRFSKKWINFEIITQ